eukprot:Opistho-2@91160
MSPHFGFRGILRIFCVSMCCCCLSVSLPLRLACLSGHSISDEPHCLWQMLTKISPFFHFLHPACMRVCVCMCVLLCIAHALNWERTAKQEDDEMVLQIVYVFYQMIFNASTREVMLNQTRIRQQAHTHARTPLPFHLCCCCCPRNRAIPDLPCTLR